MAEHFRCIIVGGGPVALITAHALSSAGLDWVLLEPNDTIISPNGACVQMYPHTLRVMDQLGLLEQLLRMKSFMYRTKIINHEAELSKTLYGVLSEKDRSRVKTGKQVRGIKISDHGTAVHCADGSIEWGSIIVGADGVQSTIRGLMWKMARETDSQAKIEDDQPFKAAYRALWGTVPTVEEMEPSEAWECHGPDSSSQLFIGRGRAWFFVYEKLDTPTRDFRTYTKDDMDKYARKFMNMPMTDKFSFRDLYAASHSCGMSDLHEGVLKRFSWNRIVLVGDAMVAQTPNCGLGFNSGVQDVVALVNSVRKLALDRKDRPGVPVTTEEIRVAFEKYEASRRDDALRSVQISANDMKVHTWATVASWLRDRCVNPVMGADKKAYDKTMSILFARGLILDYTEERDPQGGKIPWVHG